MIKRMNRPISLYGPLRRSLFPFFDFWELAGLLFLIVLAVAFGFSLRDYYAFFFTFSVAYVIYAFSLNRFTPYVMNITSAELVLVQQSLDKVKFLRRMGESLCWERTSFLARQKDRIFVESCSGEIKVFGRKHDIFMLQRFLRSGSPRVA